VIETNLVKRDNMTRLVQADVVSLTQLPGPTDLIFSRQMMQHMCNSDVRRVLDLISRSGARFALLTHFETDMANSDIHCNSGGYRPQDLLKPPFSLPPPIRYWCAHRPSAHLVRTLYVRLWCRSPRAPAPTLAGPRTTASTSGSASVYGRCRCNAPRTPPSTFGIRMMTTPRLTMKTKTTAAATMTTTKTAPRRPLGHSCISGERRIHALRRRHGRQQRPTPHRQHRPHCR